MQEMQLNGEILREFFTTREVLNGTAKRRRNHLEKTYGAKFLRMVWVDRSKYQPHIGRQECERRIRQAQAA